MNMNTSTKHNGAEIYKNQQRENRIKNSAAMPSPTKESLDNDRKLEKYWEDMPDEDEHLGPF